MNRAIASAWILGLLLLTAHATARQPDGTLGLIQTPNNGIPAIIAPGKSFPVFLKEAADLALSLAGLCPDPASAAMGLSELLVNAVEHGNLGIGYVEKSEMRRNDTWDREIDARLHDPVLGARRARIAFRRMPDALAFTISDEGVGFDWRSYLEFAPERAFDPNGRGIAMARLTSFSALDYRDRGNIVVATVPCAHRPS